MSKIIMSVETVKIKDFIFSTNKLKVIRGASYLLDYLNQVKVPEILEKNGVKEENIIYVGAGNAKFFVSSEDVAKKIEKEIKDLYRKEAPGAKIAVAYKETLYGTEVKSDRKVWDDIDDLAKMIAIEKSKGFAMDNIDLPFMEKCELCGTEPASIYSENIEEDIKNIKSDIGEVDSNKIKGQIEKLAKNTGKICECCFRKINADNHIKDSLESVKKPVNFYDYLINKNGIKVPLDKEIEDYEGEKSFIGFMYSDGDGLGDFLKNIANKYKNSNDKTAEKKYIDFMKEFSKTLDEKTKESLKETLEGIFSKKEIDKKDKIGEFLIVGGDDVCAVFKPHLVLEISKKFQEIFEKKMDEYTTEKEVENKITSSSGVIIAKSKTPMFHLFDQALALQKKAKAKRQKTEIKTTGFIDFQVIGSEGCVDIGKFREKISATNGKENLVMERPYAINTTNKEKAKNIDELFKIVSALKACDFPKTKIRYIYDLKRDSNIAEFQKKLEFINILSKMKEEHRKVLQDSYKIEVNDCDNFNELFENIYDILEMYDFIGGGNNEN